jgi:hypothetical protein
VSKVVASADEAGVGGPGVVGAEAGVHVGGAFGSLKKGVSSLVFLVLFGPWLALIMTKRAPSEYAFAKLTEVW